MRKRSEAARAGLPARLPSVLPALLAALWSAGPAPALAATAPFYIATDLGGFVSNGTPLNFASDLTNAGAAAGYSLVASEQFGLFWPAGGTRQAITLNGQLLAANDLGVWVGAQNGQMTRWVDGLAEVIDTRANSVAQLVNNPGWVVGQAPGAGTLLWRAGLGETAVTGIGLARALNDNGVIAGATSVNGGQRAAYWTLADGLSTVAVTGGDSELRDINNHGVFVGDVVHAGGTRSFIGSIGGSVADLVLPAGYTGSHVWAINDSGAAVGLVSSDPTNLAAASTRVALWQNGGVRVLDVHGAAVFNWAGFVDINNSGQILVGANVGSSAFSPAHASFILNACSRCGQIHPNPNPAGSSISLDADWSTPFNGEDFDNRGAILVNSTLDNLPGATLTTQGDGFIDVNGSLHNLGTLVFQRDSNAVPALRVLHGGAVLQDADTASTINRGLVLLDGGLLQLDQGLWRNEPGSTVQASHGARLQITNGLLNNAAVASLDLGPATVLTVHAAQGGLPGGILANQGWIDLHGGNIVGMGRIFNNSSGQIDLRGGAGQSGKLLLVSARMESAGLLRVMDDGVLDIDDESRLRLSHGELAATGSGLVRNDGVLWVDRTARLTVMAPQNDTGVNQGLVNTGLWINMGSTHIDGLNPALGQGDLDNSGQLVISQGFDNAGRFYNRGGGTAELGAAGGFVRNLGPGRIELSSQVVAVDESAGVNLVKPVAGAFQPSTLRLLSATFNDGVLQVGNGATLSLGARLTNQGHGLVLVDAGGALLPDAQAPTAAQYLQTGSAELFVDGAMVTDTFVCTGGAVHGTGHIVASGGFSLGLGCTVAPGNSPGTLTLQGDVTLDGAALAMQIGAGSADRLVIDGRLTLRSAQVNLSFIDGAMPDPDLALDLFSLSLCQGCSSVDSLALTIIGAAPGWQARLATAAQAGGAAGNARLQLDNPDALVLPADLLLDSAWQTDAGSVVFQSHATQVASGVFVNNQGAFYNRPGAVLRNAGGWVNAGGSGLLNHGVVVNSNFFLNQAGAAFNNRGEVHNVDGDNPAQWLNAGQFNNEAGATLRNGDAPSGRGAQFVNTAGAVFANRGLVVNRDAVAATPQTATDAPRTQFVNNGRVDNWGQIDSNAVILNEGGTFIIHAGGSVTGNGLYRQTAGGSTVVNGLLVAQLQLADGTRLGGTGQVVGAVAGGQVAPGDHGVGQLAIDGPLLGTSFEIELAGDGGFDQLRVTGGAQAGATRVVFLTGFTPHAGAHYTWLQAGALLGQSGVGAVDLGDVHLLSFATLVDNGMSEPFAVDLVEAAAPVRVGGTAYHVLDIGGVRLYAAAEAGADSFGLTFLAALPAPVPEPSGVALWLVGLLGWRLRGVRSGAR